MNSSRWCLGKTVGLSVSVIFLLVVISCAKKQEAPPLKRLDQATRAQVMAVEPVPTRQKNAHVLELFESEQRLRSMVAGGYSADDTTQLNGAAEQRGRQFQNALQERPTGRIVGGKPAANFSDPRRFRFQVALVYTGYPTVPDGQFCSGTLIDPQYVLTAAHCVRTLSWHDVMVYVGSYKLSTGGNLIGLAQNGIAKHEQYNNSDVHPVNDIALLKLASAVTGISPVPLADADKEASVAARTTNAIISGWGDTAEGSKSGSDDLLWTNVNIMGEIQCKDAYGNMISDSMFCATKKNSDSCQGDSGGPLVILDSSAQWYEEGIISWGIGCAESGKPGVYVRIPLYRTWISQHMTPS